MATWKVSYQVCYLVDVNQIVTNIYGRGWQNYFGYTIDRFLINTHSDCGTIVITQLV